MRILHLYKDYYPVLGGIENYIKVLAEAQAAEGHQVTVLVCATGHRSGVTSDHGVTIYRAARLTTVASMPLSLLQPLQLAKLQADIIHLHAPYPLGEISTWLFKRRIPWVMTYHSDVVRQRGWLRLYAPLLRRILRRVDRILVTSPRYLETSKWLRPVRERCVVSPLGVDHHRFHPPETPYLGPPRLLFVGRLRYYKGLDTLLRALPLLPGEVALEIVGNGPMLTEWQTLATRLGVASRVHFRGEVSDDALPDVYRHATIFVLPANARAEAFGTVLLEAMASGLPCVTTEVGSGTSWVVQDNVTGYVVPPAQPEALAHALRTLLADAELRQRMGRAARERVEAEFTQDAMVARVLTIYQEVVSGGPSCFAWAP